MPGLLDFANTDEGMQGLGLLAAAAPQMAPMNLAGRLAQAAQGYQGLRKEAVQNKILQLQELRAQQQFEMQKDAYYGSPSDSMRSSIPSAMSTPSMGQPSGMAGQMPTSQLGGMPSSPTSMAPQSNLSAQLDRLGRMALAGIPGAKEQFEILKYKNDPQTYAPGSVSVNRMTGQVTTVPTVSTDGKSSQLIPDASVPGGFRVIAPEGAVDTFGAYADRAKDNEIVAVPDGNGGSRQMLGKNARMLFSGQSASPSQPSQLPQPKMQNAGWAGAEPKGSFEGDSQQIMNTLLRIKDPQERAGAMRAFQNQMNGTNPDFSSQGQGGQQLSRMAGATQGGQFGYTPPASQLEADKAQALAGVSQSTKPQLDYSTNAATAFQKMGDNINGRLSESQALLQRISESRDALSRFKAGGGNETRLGMAQTAQGLGMPTSIVDKIAGGDLSAVQEFQKFAAQEALQTMQQSLSTDSGPAAKGNRLSMDLFIKNNPNITTDPRAIEKIFNFQTKLHNDALTQSDAYIKYANDPSKQKDPSLFGNAWAHDNIQSGRVNPVMQTGQAMGTAPATNSGFTAQVNGKTYSFPNQKALANFKLEAGIK